MLQMMCMHFPFAAINRCRMKMIGTSMTKLEKIYFTDCDKITDDGFKELIQYDNAIGST
jgi:hypothetical protein